MNTIQVIHEQIPTIPTAYGLIEPFLAQTGNYGFWGPIISTLRGIGVAVSGIGLVIALLIKGAAAANGDRHALAARVAEGVFAGLFIVLLGWFIYDKIVEWTPL